MLHTTPSPPPSHAACCHDVTPCKTCMIANVCMLVVANSVGGGWGVWMDPWSGLEWGVEGMSSSTNDVRRCVKPVSTTSTHATLPRWPPTAPPHPHASSPPFPLLLCISPFPSCATPNGNSTTSIFPSFLPNSTCITLTHPPPLSLSSSCAHASS